MSVDQWRRVSDSHHLVFMRTPGSSSDMLCRRADHDPTLAHSGRPGGEALAVLLEPLGAKVWLHRRPLTASSPGEWDVIACGHAAETQAVARCVSKYTGVVVDACSVCPPLHLPDGLGRGVVIYTVDTFSGQPKLPLGCPEGRWFPLTTALQLKGLSARAAMVIRVACAEASWATYRAARPAFSPWCARRGLLDRIADVAGIGGLPCGRGRRSDRMSPSFWASQRSRETAAAWREQVLATAARNEPVAGTSSDNWDTPVAEGTTATVAELLLFTACRSAPRLPTVPVAAATCSTAATSTSGRRLRAVRATALDSTVPRSYRRLVADDFDTPASAWSAVVSALRSRPLRDPWFHTGQAAEILSALGCPDLLHDRDTDFFSVDLTSDHVIVGCPPWSKLDSVLTRLLDSNASFCVLVPDFPEGAAGYRWDGIQLVHLTDGVYTGTRAAQHSRHTQAMWLTRGLCLPVRELWYRHGRHGYHLGLDGRQYGIAPRTAAAVHTAACTAQATMAATPTPLESTSTTTVLESVLTSEAHRFGRNSWRATIDRPLTDWVFLVWNCNGVRRRSELGQFTRYMRENADVDVHCLLETKCPINPVSREMLVAISEAQRLGYHVHRHASDAPNGSYAGVWVFSRPVPRDVTFGLGDSTLDGEARVVTLTFPRFYAVFTYAPSSGHKFKFKDKRLRWTAAFLDFLRGKSDMPVLWLGDVNVAQTDRDVASYYRDSVELSATIPGWAEWERADFDKLLRGSKFRDAHALVRGSPTDGVYSFFRQAKHQLTNDGILLDKCFTNLPVLGPADSGRKPTTATVTGVRLLSDLYGSDHLGLRVTVRAACSVLEAASLFVNLEIPVRVPRLRIRRNSSAEVRRPAKKQRAHVTTSTAYIFCDGWATHDFACKFTVDGVTYNSVTQCLEAAKAKLFGGSKELQVVMSSEDPFVMRVATACLDGFDEARWWQAREQVAHSANLAKFSASEDLRSSLLATGTRVLVYANPQDSVWGVGMSIHNRRAYERTTWNGHNLCGAVLEEVRRDLRYAIVPYRADPVVVDRAIRCHRCARHQPVTAFSTKSRRSRKPLCYYCQAVHAEPGVLYLHDSGVFIASCRGLPPVPQRAPYPEWLSTNSSVVIDSRSFGSDALDGFDISDGATLPPADEVLDGDFLRHAAAFMASSRGDEEERSQDVHWSRMTTPLDNNGALPTARAPCHTTAGSGMLRNVPLLPCGLIFDPGVTEPRAVATDVNLAVSVTQRSTQVHLLLDTGASASFIDRKFLLHTLGRSAWDHRLPAAVSLGDAVGGVSDSCGRITLGVHIGAHVVWETFNIMSRLAVPVLLGNTAIAERKSSVCFDENVFVWRVDPGVPESISTPFIYEQRMPWREPVPLFAAHSYTLAPGERMFGVAGAELHTTSEVTRDFGWVNIVDKFRAPGSSDEFDGAASLVGLSTDRLLRGDGVLHPGQSWVSLANPSSTDNLVVSAGELVGHYFPDTAAAHTILRTGPLTSGGQALDRIAALIASTRPSSGEGHRTSVLSGSDSEVTDDVLEAAFQRAPLNRIKIGGEHVGVTQAQIRQLKVLLYRYRDVFARDESNPPTAHHEVSLKLSDEGRALPPHRAKIFRQTPDRAAATQKLVDEYLAAGRLEPSRSPWQAMALVVPKPHTTDKFRLICDFRELNARLEPQYFPMPRTDDVINAMGGTQWLSCTDVSGAFTQIRLADDGTRELTAIATPQGVYQWTTLMFGVTSAPAIWNRFISMVLEGSAISFVDDLTWASKGTFEQHLGDIERTFVRLRKWNVSLKASKTEFVRDSIDLLGHRVSKVGASKVGVRPLPDKTAAVGNLHLEDMRTAADVRHFLGLTGFYRRYIKNYARVAAPLVDLTTKHSRLPGKLTTEQRQSFLFLKSCLLSDPVLVLPDLTRKDLRFRIEVDACKTGIAGVLSLPDSKGPNVIAYVSRATRPHEKNYCIYELEALALVFALDVFRPYLRSTAKCTVFTDHRSLKYLNSQATLKGRISQWIYHLMEFDLNVVHRPGRASGNVDGLSRLAHLNTEVYNETLEATQPLRGSSLPSVPVAAALRSGRTIGGDRSAAAAPVVTVAPPEVTLPQVSTSRVDTRSLTLTNFLHAQGQDATCLAIKAGLLSDQRCGPHPFSVDSRGLLLHLGRVVVPRVLRTAVLHSQHGAPLAMHNGFIRTLAAVKARFFWNGLTKDVRAWVDGCLSCQRRKPPRPLRDGAAQIMPATAPFQRISLDFVGPFPLSEAGNRWLMTAVCGFTRWTFACPLPDKTSEAVCNALYEKIITVHSVPEQILSDREKSLVSSGVRLLCDRLNIRKIQTSGDNPQCNGQVERFHSYLAAQLTMVVNKHKTDWERFVPAVMFAHRISRCQATGYSPFEMVFGRQPRLPVDTLLGLQKQEFSSTQEYVDCITKALHEAYDAARRTQLDLALRNQVRRQRNRRTVGYAVNDSVLLWEAESPPIDLPAGVVIPKKLRWRYSGPHQVVGKVSDILYRVRHATVRRGVLSVNVNRLRKFTPWADETEDAHTSVSPLVPEDQAVAEEAGAHVNPDAPPTAGDLVVIPLDTEVGSGQPFVVGKVLSRERNGAFTVQLYGNYAGRPLKQLQPGWVDSKDNRHYFSSRSGPRGRPYTNRVCEMNVTGDNIVAWRFDLQSRLLPPGVLQLLHTSPDVSWHWPDKVHRNPSEPPKAGDWLLYAGASGSVQLGRVTSAQVHWHASTTGGWTGAQLPAWRADKRSGVYWSRRPKSSTHSPHTTPLSKVRTTAAVWGFSLSRNQRIPRRVLDCYSDLDTTTWSWATASTSADDIGVNE